MPDPRGKGKLSPPGGTENNRVSPGVCFQLSCQQERERDREFSYVQHLDLLTVRNSTISKTDRSSKTLNLSFSMTKSALLLQT
jgi:hypothetical protein